MKDPSGLIIYVGKANNLKKRLSSYFSGVDPCHADAKTTVLVRKISSFETIITETENEALILESNLIKKYKPRYNVILKDDKRYPLLKINFKNPYPVLEIVRTISSDGALYFGPFSSSASIRNTLKIIEKTFKLRKCKTKTFIKKTRPCINYQIGACLGPCCNEVDERVYRENIKEVVLFLKGKAGELIKKIRKDMLQASDNRDFEAAARYRDRMFSIEKSIEKQSIVSNDRKNRDVVALARTHELSVITVVLIRNGYMTGTRHYSFKETLSTDSEMIGMFIRQYYNNQFFIPDEIIVSLIPDDKEFIEEQLKIVKGKRTCVICPQKGDKARLVNIAIQNAENERITKIAEENSQVEMLIRLQHKLKGKRFPARIECFDNSNTSGVEPVSGMVVFSNGKPEKTSYRRYKIKTAKGQNDYAYLSEVLSRRYGKGIKSKPFPDLLMVDGGKGHLNIAMSVLKELNIINEFDVAGIAKKDDTKGERYDKIYVPGRHDPIRFSNDMKILLFLQRIRDEAHRYTISFHRKSRDKASFKSELDNILGIGKKRKRLLLKHFGGIKKIRAATVEELGSLPGMNRRVAENLHRLLNEKHNPDRL